MPSTMILCWHKMTSLSLVISEVLSPLLRFREIPVFSLSFHFSSITTGAQTLEHYSNTFLNVLHCLENKTVGDADSRNYVDTRLKCPLILACGQVKKAFPGVWKAVSLPDQSTQASVYVYFVLYASRTRDTQGGTKVDVTPRRKMLVL